MEKRAIKTKDDNKKFRNIKNEPLLKKEKINLLQRKRKKKTRKCSFSKNRRKKNLSIWHHMIKVC